MKDEREKLVRDRIPNIANNPFRVASKDEVNDILSAKLLEEANEVVQELISITSISDDRSKLNEELADLLEVIDAIKTHLELSDADIQEIKRSKSISKGSFCGLKIMKV